MLVKWIPGLNFTNLLAQSINVPTKRVWCNQFNQQNFNQLNKYTQLEVMPNLYALCSAPYTSKLSIILMSQKAAWQN